jgi:hypothetical protein
MLRKHWHQASSQVHISTFDSAENSPFRRFGHLQVVDNQGPNLCIFLKTGGFSAESTFDNVFL